jgi:hypothetical protein
VDLDVLPDEYAVCRLRAGSPLPDALARESGPPRGSGASRESRVISITWTADEVSIICPSELVPAGAVVETPWRCVRVAGPLDHALTGILASLVNPLAAARVNVFAFSTFDTDYLLVPAVRLVEAVTALAAAGHRLTGSPLQSA